MINPLSYISVHFIKLYRLVLSPWIGQQCRFHPTCSCYTEESIKRFGFVKGWALGVARILSCHPYSKRPWSDPVPERFALRALLGYKQGTHENKPPQ